MTYPLDHFLSDKLRLK